MCTCTHFNYIHNYVHSIVHALAVNSQQKGYRRTGFNCENLIITNCEYF